MLGQILGSKDQPIALRIAALDALGGMGSRQAFNLRFAVVFDPSAPPELVARALPALGRTGSLPPNDLADFLDNKPKAVQVAALLALREVAKLPPEVHERIVAKLDDPDPDVRHAAIDAVARLRLAAAVPKLIALAKVEETRADATVALAAMPDARALDVYLAALDDRNADIRQVAQSALVRIRGQVAAELTRRARAGEFQGGRALAVERVLTEFRPVVDWRVTGPFPRTTAQLFFGDRSIDFGRTQPGVGGRPVAWQARRGDPKLGRVVLDDFKTGPGQSGFDAGASPDLAAFAYAEVPSDRDRDAIILVGSSGQVAVSVNEAIVHNQATIAGRPYAHDSDLVRVQEAQQGDESAPGPRHRQGTGAWTFSVQLSEPSALIFAAKPKPSGIEALRTFALSHTGDVRKGEEMFFDPKGLNCAKCHTVNGRGTAGVGPDLAGLALKYDKAEVIRSVLEPSSGSRRGISRSSSPGVMEPW